MWVHVVTSRSTAGLLLWEWCGVLSSGNASSNCQACLWWVQATSKQALQSREVGKGRLRGGLDNAGLHSGLHSAGESLGSISLASLGADLDADDMEAVHAMLCNSD